MATGSAWGADRVLGLATDGASARAGQALASARHWDNLGRRGDLLWGECRGSGIKPYRCRVDVAGPATSCSCPSRKSPCKHALGLMLVRADAPADLPDADPPDWVAAWAEDRARKAGSRGDATSPAGVTGDAGRRKREAARESKVAAGLDDLDRWVGDLVRSGFVGLAARPESIWVEQARRLIDAQCPGLARRVARIAAMPRAGEGWQAALLDRLGQLHLIAEGFRRRDRLPAPVVDDLRAAIGFPTDGEAVRAGAIGTHVRDTWLVLGQVFGTEDKVQMRRVSLRGAATGRPALVIDYAGPGRPFEAGLEPGTTVALTLGFFPGAAPLRALVVERHAPPVALAALDGARSIAEAQAELGALLARSPWVDLIPVALAHVSLQATADGWHAVEPSGAFVPLSPRFDRAWHVLALSGGGPFALLGELSGANLHPTGALIAGTFVALSDADEATHAPPLAGSPGRWPTPETPFLHDLAASAVLGTERKPPPDPGRGDPLGPVATATAGRDAPSRLLALTGAAGLHARAGRRASVGPAPVADLAPDGDDRPVCPSGAADCLRRLLAGEFGGPTGGADLFYYWVAACDDAGYRLPGAVLAEILSICQGAIAPPKLAPILGTRGRWLAGQNPQWRHFRFDRLPDPAAIAATWNTGTKVERLALLRELRRTDPDAARDLAATTFAAEPADFRNEITHALRIRLTMADEPMLEAALDDRSRDVRATAAVVLGDLAASRLVGRMTARARAILGWDGDRLAVDPPSEADAAMIRDGLGTGGPSDEVDARRTRLLGGILSRVPPRQIAEHLGRSPDRILAAARATAFAAALSFAWGAAAADFGDPTWCRALLCDHLDHPDQLPVASVPGLKALLAGMGPTDRDALLLAEWIRHPDDWRTDRSPLALLAAVGGEFGPELGRAVAERLGPKLVGSIRALRELSPGQTLRIEWMGHIAQGLIPKLPLGLVDEFSNSIRPELAEAGPHHQSSQLNSTLRDVLDRWTFRRDILQEFAPR